MSVISRLILVQSDPRVQAAVRFGFEREGSAVVALAEPSQVSALIDVDHDEPTQLIVAGAGSRESAQSMLASLRSAIADRGGEIPILYLGNGVTRQEALDAGAAEVVSQPAFLRDVVTVGKLLVSPKPGTHRRVATGNLGDHLGVYYVMRALSAVQATGVLTMVRGLRRGELRFYEGEVTSAQVGVLHAQAALHQLLLWTEAKFEMRTESVVRRRQIPLDRKELLADAARFLGEIRAVAPRLSPSSIFEHDVAMLGRVGRTMPRDIVGVLRLFDGYRTVADVIEDAPFRVFETLRVAEQLRRIGVITPVGGRSPRQPTRSSLKVEEWLLGSQDFGSDAQLADAASGEELAKSTDWTVLLPSAMPPPSDGGLSQVVPATEAVGEIVVGAQETSHALANAKRSSASVAEVLEAPSTREGALGAAEAASDFAQPRAAETTPEPATVVRQALAKPSSETDATAAAAPAVSVPTASHREMNPVKAEAKLAHHSADEDVAAPNESSKTERVGARPGAAADEKSGEILVAEVTAEPSAEGDPSVLVEAADAARVGRAAVAAADADAAVRAPVAAPSDADSRDASHEAEAALVHRGASRAAAAVAQFSADEEAFFSAGSELHQRAEAGESFEALELPEPPSLWQRLLSWFRPAENRWSRADLDAAPAPLTARRQGVAETDAASPTDAAPPSETAPVAQAESEPAGRAKTAARKKKKKKKK